MFNDNASRNFGLNYDPSHFALHQMYPISPLREFKQKLFHLHAKDMTVHAERLNEVGIFAFPREWHTPRIPGMGDINWARLMATLYEIGYDGPVCIEVEDDTFGKSLEGRMQALTIAVEHSSGMCSNREGGKARTRRRARNARNSSNCKSNTRMHSILTEMEDDDCNRLMCSNL
jgi:sugar phosphate isomerase/epimerase